MEKILNNKTSLFEKCQFLQKFYFLRTEKLKFDNIVLHLVIVIVKLDINKHTALNLFFGKTIFLQKNPTGY